MNTGKKALESMSQAIWYNKWTMDLFKTYLKGDILEVGCGIGNFTNSLSSFGRVWAIDIDKNYINETKHLTDKKAKVGFGDIEKGEYFFESASRDEQKKFDSVVCLNVLEHIRNDSIALKNLHNLLNDKGKLILLVPAHKFLYTKIDEELGHFRRYEKQRITKDLKNSGFQISTIRSLNFLGAIGWFISGKILNDGFVDESKIKFFNFLSPFFLKLENVLEPPIGTSILIIASK